MKDLEAENARLKKIYANLSLVHDALKDAVEKSSELRPETHAGHADEQGAYQHGESIRQGYRAVGLTPEHLPIQTEAKARSRSHSKT